jgi:hypothetical protein
MCGGAPAHASSPATDSDRAQPLQRAEKQQEGILLDPVLHLCVMLGKGRLQEENFLSELMHDLMLLGKGRLQEEKFLSEPMHDPMLLEASHLD